MFDPKKYNVIYIDTSEILPIFIVEKESYAIMNIPQVSELFERGWGNGYVCLPSWHPFYKVDCNNIEVDIHGGLTYGKLDEEKDFWVIGFDTAHFGDNSTTCPMEYVIEQTKYLQYQCLELEEVKRMRKLNKISNILKS